MKIQLINVLIYINLSFLAEIEVAAVVAESDVVDILEVFPCPVEGCELAVRAVFLGDAVAGVVTLESEVEFGMECLAYLYGHIDVILTDIRVGFVARNEYLDSWAFMIVVHYVVDILFHDYGPSVRRF